MNADNIISTFDLVSFITGIVSIVLAVVSLIVTFIFYKWNEKSTEHVRELSNDVKCKTETLSTLFNKMFDTSFRMIESQSTAMQKQLFSHGSVETNDVLNYEFEILSLIIKEKEIPITNICEKFHLEESRVKTIVDKISERGSVKMEDERVVFSGNDEDENLASDSSQE